MMGGLSPMMVLSIRKEGTYRVEEVSVALTIETKSYLEKTTLERKIT
jgi:hypothetical protein